MCKGMLSKHVSNNYPHDIRGINRLSGGGGGGRQQIVVSRYMYSINSN